MESTEQTNQKKRSIIDVEHQHLLGKFRSKQDFIVFLDQHRRYLLQPILTPFQSSSTCPMKRS